MDLFDGCIADVFKLLAPYSPRELEVNPASAWKDIGCNQFLLAQESAFELGASGLPSVNLTAATSSAGVIATDRIVLYGPDLPSVTGNVPYARIALLNIDDIADDTDAYHVLKDLDFIKYDIHPEGFVIRTSSFDRREQIRVAKSAVKNGIDFTAVGNLFLNKYKAHERVKNVQLVFICADIPVFAELTKIAEKANNIVLALNHVLSDMNFDCNSCNMKAICDEVEGMRELHFKHRH